LEKLPKTLPKRYQTPKAQKEERGLFWYSELFALFTKKQKN
jgi:hypothetical protein